MKRDPRVVYEVESTSSRQGEEVPQVDIGVRTESRDYADPSSWKRDIARVLQRKCDRHTL